MTMTHSDAVEPSTRTGPAGRGPALGSPGETIAFVGLGAMGLPMSLRLLRAGYQVRGGSRAPQRLERFAAVGGRVCLSLTETLRGADVVITMLPDGAVVRDVVDREGGVAQTVPAGTLLIDMSTVNPRRARELASRGEELGIEVLDAPVSGGVAGARAGTLTIMVGGPERALERARPLLEAMGTTITHLGPAGSGQVVKAANQLIVGAGLAALGEAVLLLQAGGVDAESALRALSGGLAGSRIMELKAPAVLARDFSPTFTVGLHAKDMGIVQDLAGSVGCVLPVLDTVTQAFNAAVANGWADLDHAAVVQVAELLSGTHRNDRK
ncbi:NAD(P)-dependent oxidoreductase [Actinomyces respiraculi]|uniref:NAD(P)-dependent oxidoreductase n=1 Tax=Actinomyces respiraculi TaxID=2744574 RepID=UPI001F28CA17|nr:NAD(P)-dependent oxidoreductase [Actinomyces respiraculi]